VSVQQAAVVAWGCRLAAGVGEDGSRGVAGPSFSDEGGHAASGKSPLEDGAKVEVEA
jgi:hypothetical protein